MKKQIVWLGHNLTQISDFLGHENFWHKDGNLTFEHNKGVFVVMTGQSVTLSTDNEVVIETHGNVAKKDKVTFRNGYPTKASIYRIANDIGVRFTSLDNRTNIDSINWQHGDVDKIEQLIHRLSNCGVEIYDHTQYKPSRLESGSFKIRKQNS